MQQYQDWIFKFSEAFKQLCKLETVKYFILGFVTTTRIDRAVESIFTYLFPMTSEQTVDAAKWIQTTLK